MKVVPWGSVGRERLVRGPMVGTVGVFDGVHRGHQALLEELRTEQANGARSLVVTFRANPKKMFQPGYLGDLMSWDEKATAFERAGVDWVVLIDFSPEFSIMPGRDFFLTLKKSFVFSKLVFGWDFSFGKGSATRAADLGWLADPQTRLTILPPVTIQGQVVSSSAVRMAIAEGNLIQAERLLGRPYSFSLEYPSSLQGGRCTVPREFVGKLLPPPGIYPVHANGQRTDLMVEQDRLSWESPPGIRLQEIVFA